jgi:hypothetical protein
MRMRPMATVAAACVVAASAFLAGCGPKSAPALGRPTTGPTLAATPSTSAPATSAPATSAPATPAVKDLNPGNCTIYAKADAVKLLGGVNLNNKALDIGTDGGTKIDLCSYLDLKGQTDLQGVSYAVVRYDSAATAFTEAKKVKATMLSSAAEHNWPVQSLTTPAPGAGQVLGGYGTKTEQGLTFTIAVVGTNVGPYLVAALGGSTESVANAKKFALTVFAALSSAVG